MGASKALRLGFKSLGACLNQQYKLAEETDPNPAENIRLTSQVASKGRYNSTNSAEFRLYVEVVERDIKLTNS